jgi:hypothetical protein
MLQDAVVSYLTAVDACNVCIVLAQGTVIRVANNEGVAICEQLQSPRALFMLCLLVHGMLQPYKRSACVVRRKLA